LRMPATALWALRASESSDVCDHADIHPWKADFVRSESFRRQI
jgi:hypothetical protein